MMTELTLRRRVIRTLFRHEESEPEVIPASRGAGAYLATLRKPTKPAGHPRNDPPRRIRVIRIPCESRELRRCAIVASWADPASRAFVAPSAGVHMAGIPAAAEGVTALRTYSSSGDQRTVSFELLGWGESAGIAAATCHPHCSGRAGPSDRKLGASSRAEPDRKVGCLPPISPANAQRSAAYEGNRLRRAAEGMKRCASRLAAGRTAVAAGLSDHWAGRTILVMATKWSPARARDRATCPGVVRPDFGRAA